MNQSLFSSNIGEQLSQKERNILDKECLGSIPPGNRKSAAAFGIRLRTVKHRTSQAIVAAAISGGNPPDEETGRGSILVPRDK